MKIHSRRCGQMFRAKSRTSLLHPLIWVYLSLAICLRAHVVEQFYAEYKKNSHNIILNFDIAYAIPETRDVIDAPQPTRNWLVEQTDEQHKTLRQEAQAYIRSYIQFESNGTKIDYNLIFSDFENKQRPYPFIKLLNQGGYYTIELSPVLNSQPPKTLSIRIKDGSFPNLIISDQSEENISFETVKPSMLFTLKTPSSSPFNLIILGFNHVIPDGLDHILFIIGMCLIATNAKQLLLQSIIFTLSHALSMALVISNILPISITISSYIEAFIALSITFIATERFFPKIKLTWKFTIIGLFGIFHGLGFASSLGSSLQFINADHWIIPLILANIGIEIAQALLVITCYFILIAVKKYHSSRTENSLRNILAIIISTISILWFIERLP